VTGYEALSYGHGCIAELSVVVQENGRPIVHHNVTETVCGGERGASVDINGWSSLFKKNKLDSHFSDCELYTAVSARHIVMIPLSQRL
jgi:hypothetical protein